MIYVDYALPGLESEGAGAPDVYSLFWGNESPTSTFLSVVQPPTLMAPTSGVASTDTAFTSLNGNFYATAVPAATNYVLQISSSPVFGSGTDPVTGNPMTVTINNLQNTMYGVPQPVSSEMGNYPLATLISNFAAATQRTLYWRIGARVYGDPIPSVAPGSSDPYMNNWVYSAYSTIVLAPATAATLRSRTPGAFLNKMQSGRAHTRLLRE